MVEPEADRRHVDEAQEALGGLVVAGGNAVGVLELVESALDKVAQPVERAIHGHVGLAGFPHRDDRDDVSRFFQGFAYRARPKVARAV